MMIKSKSAYERGNSQTKLWESGLLLCFHSVFSVVQYNLIVFCDRNFVNYFLTDLTQFMLF